MVYLIFRSSDTDERFDMGCLIMLDNNMLDNKVLDECSRYVTNTIHGWTPEKRWESFFGKDGGTPRCVTFRYKDYDLVAAQIKLPHYVPEIFCLVVGSDAATYEDVYKAAYDKYYPSTLSAIS